MFCPQCKAEYRPGFTRCADCDVDLVYELESNSLAEERVRDAFRVIWRGVRQESCLGVCGDLRDLGINYKVDEIPGFLGYGMRVSRRYQLAVPSDDYQRAKAGLGIKEDLPVIPSESEWEKLEELEEAEESNGPEESSAEPAEEDEGVAEDFACELKIRRDAYFKLWYPEDATVEIWSQGNVENEDISGGIEMALKEHFIHCRLDVNDGVHKLFVLPDDEIRAGEIIREITNDASPE
jgi:hypothetical protein